MHPASSPWPHTLVRLNPTAGSAMSSAHDIGRSMKTLGGTQYMHSKKVASSSSAHAITSRLPFVRARGTAIAMPTKAKISENKLDRQLKVTAFSARSTYLVA